MDGRIPLIATISALALGGAAAGPIPVVRVGLASLGTPSLAIISSDQGFGALRPAGNQRVATWLPGQKVSVRAEGADVILGDKRLPSIYFSSIGPTLSLSVGSATRRYRGWLYLMARAGKLTIVNELPLESYLMGVVPCEMGSGSPAEALRAQAVAARTYTLTKVGSFSKYGYDVDDTTKCHLYRGADAEKPSTNDAVRQTSNQILVYGGRPIQALYATVSGGITADAREAFGGGGAPYLVPVVDKDARGNPYGAHAKYFAWTLEVPGEALRSKFKAKGVDFGPIENVEVIDRGPSGRAMNIRLTTASGAYDLNARLVRDAFGVDVIRSTLFSIRKTKGGFQIDGKGWGHGVGMCQAGAIGRARQGQCYAQILAAYYPGTQLVTVEGTALSYATRGSYVDRVKFVSGR